MSFSNLASGNRHCSWSLSDGFFPFNFGWFPHTRALVPTLLSVLGGHLQVSGFFFCASLSSRVLCPAKSSMLISSEPQLRLLSSVSLPSGSPSLHRSLDGEVSPGGKQGSPRARLLSSLSRRGHSPLLPHVQCCEDYCLINFVWFFFFIVSVAVVKSSLWHSVLKRSRSLLILDCLGLLICLLLALRESPVPWWRAQTLESDQVTLWSTTS